MHCLRYKVQVMLGSRECFGFKPRLVYIYIFSQKSFVFLLTYLSAMYNVPVPRFSFSMYAVVAGSWWRTLPLGSGRLLKGIDWNVLTTISGFWIWGGKAKEERESGSGKILKIGNFKKCKQTNLKKTSSHPTPNRHPAPLEKPLHKGNTAIYQKKFGLPRNSKFTIKILIWNLINTWLFYLIIFLDSV